MKKEKLQSYQSFNIEISSDEIINCKYTKRRQSIHNIKEDVYNKEDYYCGRTI